MTIKAITLAIIISTSCSLLASSDVKEYATNGTLSNVLKTHEAVMHKLIVDNQLLEEKLATLQKNNEELLKEFKKLQSNLKNETQLQAKTQSVKSEYDEEFKNYLKTNR